tara:strand:+ start:220 stop:483 length:264 start_codon:yes stop_codon:yes gene_type:complete
MKSVGLRFYMFYKDLVEDAQSLYETGLQKFLESKRYQKARQKYLELEQDYSNPKSNKKLDNILGIIDEPTYRTHKLKTPYKRLTSKK